MAFLLFLAFHGWSEANSVGRKATLSSDDGGLGQEGQAQHPLASLCLVSVTTHHLVFWKQIWMSYYFVGILVCTIQSSMDF